MNVRKFSASTSREALRKVRDALGPDAVIVSNRNVNGQVEIVAMDDSTLESIAPVMPKSERQPEKPLRFSPPSAAMETDKPVRKGIFAASTGPEDEVNVNATLGAQEVAVMMNEIRSMRSILENKITELSWANIQQREPVKAELMREMLSAGFGAGLARQLIEKMPNQENPQAGLDWIKSVLAHNLSTIGNENEILEKGGVYALVGPTGVGKTTTTAKLAARCVMRHGPSKLALITTDGYRIGAYEQLRIYGKILGVMVHSVKDESDLRIALEELKNKHTVLIDTVGVSQRDKMVTEQIAMLSGSGLNVKKLLCLNATSTGETLTEVVRAYAGSGLSGCILTKLDEAATIGGVLDIAIRQKLGVYYVASGQRVPEDLHVANRQYLIDRAFKLKRETNSYRLQLDELALKLNAASSSAEVHLA